MCAEASGECAHVCVTAHGRIRAKENLEKRTSVPVLISYILNVKIQEPRPSTRSGGVFEILWVDPELMLFTSQLRILDHDSK